jgi:hypothetical protein
MSAVTPPQSTVCSPNRSVSVSSWNVVEHAGARASRCPSHEAKHLFGDLRRVLCHGDERRHADAVDGTACAACPGPFGAIIDVDVGRRLDLLK